MQEPPDRLRLAGHAHFETADADEATSKFSLENRHFRQEIEGGTYYHASNTAKLERISISSMWADSPRKVWCEADGRNYLVVLWSTGTNEYRANGQRLQVNSGEGLVMVPHLESYTRSSGNQYVTVISIPSEILQKVAEYEFATPARPVLPPFENIGIIPRASNLWQMVRHLLTQLELGMDDMPMAARKLEDALLTCVLETALQMQPALRFLTRDSLLLKRRRVRQAENFIAAHLDKIVLSDLARAIHVSKRTLEYDFRDILNKPLQTVILEMRLHQARRELEQQPYATVKSIAAQCGFSSSGRFAADYQKHFHESPKETQLRARK